MAYSVLDEISSTEEERIQYENELIFELDRRSGINYALNQGRIEGKIEGKIEGVIGVARSLKSMNISVELIEKATGLSANEIENL